MAKSAKRAHFPELLFRFANIIRVLSLFDGFFVIFKFRNRNTHCHGKSIVI